METSLKTGFAQSFSRCPKNLSCPKFGGAAAPPQPVRLWLCHKVNLPRCVARRPLCHKVNLQSCVARWPLGHKVNLLRCEARRCRFIMTCDIFGTGQTNILGLCYLFRKTYKQPTVAPLKSLKSTHSIKLLHLLRRAIPYH